MSWTRRSNEIGVMRCINRVGWRIWKGVWIRDVATRIILEWWRLGYEGGGRWRYRDMKVEEDGGITDV